MPLSNSLYGLFAADVVTKCRVPGHNLILGRHNINENGVYKMWSSNATPAVRISAARSSILRISWSELLPGVVLNLSKRRERSRLTPSIRGPYHEKRASHASLGETPMQYAVFALGLESRRQ